MNKEDIISVLNEINSNVDYYTCKTLIDDCVFDSLMMFSIVANLEDKFNVTIPTVEIIPDNFNSVEKIEEMLNRLISK